MKTAPELARAKHSLACVELVKADDNVPNEKYLSYAESLPATILMNGLGQAVASLCSAAKEKKKDPHWILYRDLEGWLNEFDGSPYRNIQMAAIEAITDGSPDDHQSPNRSIAVACLAEKICPGLFS